MKVVGDAQVKRRMTGKYFLRDREEKKKEMKKGHLLHCAILSIHLCWYSLVRVVNIDIYISSSAGGGAIQQSGGYSFPPSLLLAA